MFTHFFETKKDHPCHVLQFFGDDRAHALPFPLQFLTTVYASDLEYTCLMKVPVRSIFTTLTPRNTTPGLFTHCFGPLLALFPVVACCVFWDRLRTERRHIYEEPRLLLNRTLQPWASIQKQLKVRVETRVASSTTVQEEGEEKAVTMARGGGSTVARAFRKPETSNKFSKPE